MLFDWTAAGVLIALICLIITLMKLSSEWGKVAAAMVNLQECIKELRDSNKESHGRIHCKLEDHDEYLADHDKRITILETKEK